MPKQEWRDGQADWRGGANSVNDARQLLPNQFVSGVNLLIDVEGGLYCRQGFNTVTSAAFPSGTCLGVTSWGKDSGTSENIAVFANGTTATVYKNNSSPWSFTSVGTFTTAGFSPISFARLRDSNGNAALYMAELANSSTGGGINSYYRWVPANSTLTTLTPPISICPSLLIVHNQRLFAVSQGGAGDRADRLYWSALNNGDTLGDVSAGGGNTRIEVGGGIIVDALSVGASLIILHSNGISRFTGWNADDIAVSTQTVTATSGLGFSKASSSISLGNVAYALADSGYVYKIDESGNYEAINVQFPLPVTASTFYGGVFHDRVRSTITWLVVGQPGIVTFSLYSFNYLTGGWTTGTLSGLGGTENIRGVYNGIGPFSAIPLIYLHSDTTIWQYGRFYTDGCDFAGSGGTPIGIQLQTKKFVTKSGVTGVKAVRYIYLEYTSTAPNSPTLQINGFPLTAKAGGLVDTTLCFQPGAGNPTNSYQFTINDTTLAQGNKISAIVMEGFEYGARF